MAIAKEQLQQIIADNNITNVGDIYALFKDSFKDMLQELLEAEMNASIGYEKNDKVNVESDNKRNGYSQKTVKSQYGEIPLAISRDREGIFEPKIVPKYQRDMKTMYHQFSKAIAEISSEWNTMAAFLFSLC